MMAMKPISGCQLRFTTVIKVMSSGKLTIPHKAVLSYTACFLNNFKPFIARNIMGICVLLEGKAEQRTERSWPRSKESIPDVDLHVAAD